MRKPLRPLAIIAATGMAAAVLTATPATAEPGCVWLSGGWACGGALPPGFDPVDPPETEATPGHRVGGADRYETSALLSQAFGQPIAGTAVYLVAADGADALTLGGYDLNGPMLYVPRGGNDLHPAVAAEIARLAPDAVYAIGGPSAVTDAQLDAATAAGQ